MGDGPGPDLVLFDIGNQESISVTIGGVTLPHASSTPG